MLPPSQLHGAWMTGRSKESVQRIRGENQAGCTHEENVRLKTDAISRSTELNATDDDSHEICGNDRAQDVGLFLERVVRHVVVPGGQHLPIVARIHGEEDDGNGHLYKAKHGGCRILCIVWDGRENNGNGEEDGGKDGPKPEKDFAVVQSFIRW